MTERTGARTAPQTFGEATGLQIVNSALDWPPCRCPRCRSMQVRPERVIKGKSKVKGARTLSQTERLSPDSKAPPRRRIGAVVLVRDRLGRVLVVEPIYKESCILPGGGVLKDELAADAALRHLEIETGIKATITHCVAVDQVPFNPANEHSEGYNIVFNGGVVTRRQAEDAMAHDGSRGGIKACHWLYPDQLDERCEPEQASRIRHALSAAECALGLPMLFHGQPLVNA